MCSRVLSWDTLTYHKQVFYFRKLHDINFWSPDQADTEQMIFQSIKNQGSLETPIKLMWIVGQQKWEMNTTSSYIKLFCLVSFWIFWNVSNVRPISCTFYLVRRSKCIWKAKRNSEWFNCSKLTEFDRMINRKIDRNLPIKRILNKLELELLCNHILDPIWAVGWLEFINLNGSLARIGA